MGKKIGEKIESLASKIGIKPVYKWKLDEDFVYEHEAFKSINNMSHDWFEIKDNKLIIHKGYAWNGCTPKYTFWDLKYLGTFDGPVYYKTGKQKCYYASLVHDALYQFKILDRKTTNRIFYEILKESEFILAPIYYTAVKLFSHRYIAKSY